MMILLILAKEMSISTNYNYTGSVPKEMNH